MPLFTGLKLGFGKAFAAVAAAYSGYQIEKSLRFDDGDTPYLNRTPSSSTTNQKQFTFSFWAKPTSTGNRSFFSCGSNSQITGMLQMWLENGRFIIYSVSDGYYRTNAYYRDPSAWYHFVVAVDSTLATTSDIWKLWVNGVRVTDWYTETDPAQNKTWIVNTTTNHEISGIRTYTGTQNSYWDGYLAEYYLIDGQALTASDFGEFNSTTGVWDPIEYEGTYGTNGFYLKFDNTSDLGEDSSGNDNDWTANNLSTTAGADNDSLTDTPTNYGEDSGLGGEVRGNYCTMNPLDNGGQTLSNGNLQLSYSTAGWIGGRGTMSMSSGKWFWEVTLSVGSGLLFGISKNDTALDSYLSYDGTGWGYNSGDGGFYGSGSGGSGSTYTTNDVIGVAFDADNGVMWFAKNGTWQNSATTAEIEAGTTTNAAHTGLTSGPYFPAAHLEGSYGTTVNINFGARPFSNAAPSGFKCLCTQNLPDPTIVDPSKHFDSATDTGANILSAATALTDGADFVWIKDRDNQDDGHFLFNRINDSGMDGTPFMRSNTDQTEAECGTYSAPSGNSVAWVWNAGTANVTNDASATGVGSIDSTYRANTDAGFSIVNYTGNNTAGATVAHGLNAKIDFMIVKLRDVSGGKWWTYHATQGATKSTTLDSQNAYASDSTKWNNTEPTTSVFSLGNSWLVNGNNHNLQAFCWSGVEGYSKFGVYTGNGDPDGSFVELGFRPAVIIIKSQGASGTDWLILDDKRNEFNPAQEKLALGNRNAASSSSDNYIDFLSNGFKLRTSQHQYNAANEYVYCAFASHPFKHSRAR